jgi:branched-chain amino acid aminotransferase
MPIEKTAKIWMDGEFVDWDDAQVHVLSHALHYGTGVFEGIRCYSTEEGPAIFRWPEHLRRLYDSCRIYRMEIPHSAETLTQACVDTVAANEVRHCYLRPVVARTGEHMGVYPVGVPIETFIIAWIWGRYLGEDALTLGVDVCVSSWRRPAPDSLPSLAKAGGNYLISQLSKMEARRVVVAYLPWCLDPAAGDHGAWGQLGHAHILSTRAERSQRSATKRGSRTGSSPRNRSAST